jgi:predicted glutamine amidotransferase
VNQTALFWFYLRSDKMRRASASASNNLNDFKQWEIVATGNWFSVAAFESQLIAYQQ